MAAIIGLTQEEKDGLVSHMAKEEEREKAMTDTLARGERRMEAIEKDLQPLKKMYWAVVGSASVGLFLLATLIFIYKSDRQQITEMQANIATHSIAIERMLHSHTELERDYRRDTDRLERVLDKLADKVGKK